MTQKIQLELKELQQNNTNLKNELEFQKQLLDSKDNLIRLKEEQINQD